MYSTAKGTNKLMTEKAKLQLFRKKIVIVLIIAATLYAVFVSRSIIGKLGVAILMCIILDPLVKYLMRYMPRKSRLLAVLSTFALLGLIVLVVIAQLVPIISSQFSEAVMQLEKAAEEAQRNGVSLSQALASMNPSDSVGALLPYFVQAVPSVLDFLFSFLGSIFSTVLSQLMVFGFVLFGLLEGPRWVQAIKSVLPKDRKESVIWTAQQGYKSVTSYITGNIFISLCAGGASFIFCLIAGIPYALLLGLAMVICDLIPMVGAYLCGLVLGLFGFVLVGPEVGLIAIIFVTIYQQFENQILSPLVYNKAVSLTPLTALVSVSIGGAVAGLLGALIAIPVAATAQIVLKRYFGLEPPVKISK